MKYFIAAAGFILLITLNFCSQKDKYLVRDAKYVGKDECIKCHKDKWETFKFTGMGQSFGKATRNKSSAVFNDTVIYDHNKKFYYKPFWENDTLKIMEFRVYQKDTVHKLIVPIHYIVGSGQHTNSHIFVVNNYLFQAPVTFYTQSKIWDMAPGFEVNNTRFFRKIGIECISCHNAIPKFEPASENKYYHIPEGIDCERCHGPGSNHLKKILKGEITDTSANIDFSIVNPKKLPRDKQMSICMRCHIQGIAVLKEGKTFTDFVPSENINDYIYTFTPDYGDSAFWMATHVERLMKSKCYQKSDLSCISCHNPHISVRETPEEIFNSKCSNCHKTKHFDNNCIKCHMPKINTTDIPHIAITEHKIGVYKQHQVIPAKKFFLPPKLKSVAIKKVPPEVKAQAYLKYYEAYNAPTQVLDSAKKYLQNISELKIHYFYLTQQWDSIIRNIPEKEVSAWTNYRIAEAFINKSDFPKAEAFLKKAIKQKKFHLDFNYRLAEVLAAQKKFPQAIDVLTFILNENYFHYKAYYLAGKIYHIQNKIPQAEAFYKKALKLNPDYEEAVLSYIELLISQNRKPEARKLLEVYLHFNEKSSSPYVKTLQNILQ